MSYQHILLALLVAIVWGFNFVVIKIGLTEVPPFAFAFFRYALAGLPLVLFVKRPAISIKMLIAIGLSMGLIKFSFLFVGINLGMSAGLGSLILQSQSFFTIILSLCVFHQRLSWKQGIGILIAFTGIFLIGHGMHSSSSLAGLLCVLCAAFSWATSNILVRKAGPLDSFALIVWTSSILPLPFLGMSYAFEGGIETFIRIGQQLDWTGLGCILYISWIATWIGGTGWAKLMHLYSPCIVAPYSLLIPVFAFLSGWLFLGETISLQTMLASFLVFTGLAINQWPGGSWMPSAFLRQHTAFK
ncbi:EamA family transporter [Candidatus Finniella inopinata]|uniref:EamA domain-containing protein n=1 Tax=Candidatus Finniella inopinata TaxID=1696036 RepID=A0A4Q7DH29_9PROT|nr:EamA family transporter [Candidatus Finniella inopinata]RZI45194.1 hypothetical protein EQU50_07890 [Candidatus Finniella inopinata]